MITPSFGLTAPERVLPRLALDFTTASLDPRITFTRALNTATRVNASGNVEVVNADTARFDFNPSTLACKGLLIEESRTNSIRNNTMQGAVAGSPGTTPTNWSGTGTSGVFTRTIVGTGTENGIDYIDVRYQTSGAGTAEIYFEALNAVAAASGQSWTGAHYVKIADGSTTNLDYMYVVCLGRNAANTSTTEVGTTIFTPTTSGLVTQRYARTLVLANALTAFVATGVGIAFTGATDLTVRIGLPQLELGAFPTSVIKTSTAAVTRNADVATMTGTNFSSWWNQNEGAFQVEYSSNITAGSDRRIFTAMDNALLVSNFYSLFISNGAQKSASANNLVGGANIGRIDATTAFTALATFKGGFSYKTNSRSVTTQGTATTNSANVFTPPALTNCAFGNDSTGAGSINGYIKKFNYYPISITNAELQAFTK